MTINGFGASGNPLEDVLGIKTLAQQSVDLLKTDSLGAAAQDPVKSPTPTPASVVKPEGTTQPQQPQTEQPSFNIDDLTTEMDRYKKVKNDQFMAAWEYAVKNDPERAAKAFKIAEERGIPRDEVAGNYDIAAQVLKDEAQSFDYEKLSKDSPWTAEAFSDPARMLTSHDDLDQYKQVEEETTNSFGDAAKAGYLDLYKGYLGLQIATGLIDKEYDRNDPKQWVSEDTKRTLIDLELNLKELRANPAWFAPIAEELAQLTVELPISYASGKTLGYAMGAAGSVVPGVGTAAGKVAGDVIGTTGAQWAIMAAQEMGISYLDMRAKGYSHEEAYGASVNKAVAVGALDALSNYVGRIPWKAMMRPGSKIRKSFLEGVARASAREFSDQTKAKIWRDAVRSYTTTGVVEVASETAEQAVGMVIESMTYADIKKEDRGRITDAPSLNWEDKLNSDWVGIGEELWATAKDAAVASAALGVIGPAGNYMRRKHEIGKALKVEEKLQSIIAKASGLKTLERDPEGVKRELQALMEKNGVANMHIYAEELREFIRTQDNAILTEAAKAEGITDEAKIAEHRNSVKESPTEKNLRELMPDLMAQLDQATDAEADLTINSGELLTNMARSNSVKAFTQYARVTSDSLSANSARKNAVLLDDMKKEADNMLAADRADKAERIASKERVKQILYGKMLSAGVNDEVASRSAEYEASFVVVQAENLGMMPHDYLKRFGSEYMTDEEYKAAVDTMKMQGNLPGVNINYTYAEGERQAGGSYMMAGMESPTQGDVNLAIESVEKQIADLTEKKVEPEKIQQLVDWVESAKKFRDSASVVRQQFAGVSALTANREALTQAIKRIKNGDNPETVRRETGWFKGRDNKMRFEINDSESALLYKEDAPEAGVAEEAKLGIRATINNLDAYRKKLNKILGYEADNHGFAIGELIKHDKLFSAYPWIKNVRLSFPTKGKVGDKVSTTSSLAGSHLLADKANWKNMIEKEAVPNGVSIGVGVMEPSELRILLAHEMSHMIQSFEGFARGGSVGLAGRVPTDGKSNVMNLDAVLATEANHRFVRIRDFAYKLVRNLDMSTLKGEDIGSKTNLEWIARAGEIPDGMTPDDVLKLAKPMKDMLIQIALADKIAVNGFGNLDKESATKADAVATKHAKYFWYSILEGEQEAMLVEARLDMSEEIAAISPPDENRKFSRAANIIIKTDAEGVASEGLPSTVNYSPEDEPSADKKPSVEDFVSKLVGEDVNYHPTADDADVVDAKVTGVSSIGENLASSKVDIEYVSADTGETVTKSVPLSDLSRQKQETRTTEPGVLESAPPPKTVSQRIHEEAIEEKFSEEQYRARFDIKRTIVALTERADFASIVHESAHSYEVLLFKHAADDGSPQVVKEQAMRLLEWAKVPGANLKEKLENYNKLSKQEQENISEALTYSYEKYLAEGQAPIEELQQYYATVSRVMRGIYKDVVKTLNAAYKKKYGVDLPGMDNNIRAFFDRMLASEDQIRTTMDLRSMRPVMLTDQQAKLLKISDDELSYLKDLERIAFDESVEQLTAKSIKGLVWVKNAIARKNKELAKQADAVEAKLRVEVEVEVSEQRPYKLLRMFRDGDMSAIDPRLVSNPELAALHKNRHDLKEKLQDAKKAKNKIAVKTLNAAIKDLNNGIKAAQKAANAKKDIRPKIDVDSVEKLFPKQLGEQGKSSAKFEQIKEKLKSGVNGVLSKNGVDVSQVAAIYGYDTPTEMVEELASIPSFEDAVEKRVKERMLAEHSELADVKQREAAVIEAIHNDARLKLIATQHGIIQNALSAQVGAVTPGVMSGVEKAREDMFGLMLEIETLEKDQKEAIDSGSTDVADAITAHLVLLKAQLAQIEKAIYIPGATMAEIISTARVAARDLLKKVNIADYDYKAWQLREERLAKRASEALKNGDLNMALLLTKQQMVAHEMVSQTLQLKKEAGGITEFFRKFGEHRKEDARRRDSDRMVIGLELLKLAGYDFTRSNHARNLKSVEDYNPGLIQEYQHLFDILKADSEARTSPFDKNKSRSMNIEELRVLNNIMLGVWNNATVARTAILGDKRVLLAEADKMLVDQIRATYGHLRPEKKVEPKVDEPIPMDPDMAIPPYEEPPEGGYIDDNGDLIDPPAGEKDDIGVPNFGNDPGKDPGNVRILENEAFLRTSSWLTRIQHWCEYMDGNRPDGPFTRLFWRPIKYGILNYRDRRAALRDQYSAILERIRPGLTWHPIDASQYFNYRFRNKMELLGAIQHMGNASNFSELCRNREWNESSFRRFVDQCFRDGTVTQEDMDAIQDIWNLNASLLPQAQNVHYQLHAYRFTPIPPQQINTPWGTYPGGYIPMARDPNDRRTTKGQEIGLQNSIAALYGEAQMALPTTGRNWALSRGDNRGWLVMDLGLSDKYMDSVLRFIHIMPAVRSVTEILGNRRGLISRALRLVNPNNVPMLMKWLDNVVRQSSTTPLPFSLLDKICRRVNRDANTGVMFGLIQNAVANISGLKVFLSRHSYDPRSIRYLSTGMLRAMFTHRNAEWVHNQSQLVRQRHDYRMRENEMYTRLLLKDPSKAFIVTATSPFAQFLGRVKNATYGRVQDWFSVYGHIVQRIFQDVIDRAVWMAEYDYQQRRSMSNGQPTLDHAELVMRADAAVELTQGSSEPENVSEAETGTAAWKLMTPLMSWMNMMLNHSGGKMATFLRDLGFDASNIQPRHIPAAAVIYLTSLWAPMIIGNHVNLLAAGGVKDEDEDDEIADDYFKWLTKSTIQQVPSMIPAAGNVFNTFVNKFDSAPYNDRAGAVPAYSGFESINRTVERAYNSIANDEELFQSGRDYKDFATAVGMMTGIHVKPFMKPLAYLKDVEVNRARPTSSFDYWRGMVTGTVSPESRR